MIAAWLALQAARAAPPEIVVLGIAQDGGHPQAGCAKDCCRRAFEEPAARHRVASLGLLDGDRAWLVDATPDLADQMHDLTAGGAVLSGVLLTHAHIGHYVGLVNLGREVMGSDHVPVHVMPRMGAMLQSNEPWASLLSLGHAELRPLEDGGAVALSERLIVTPFAVPHRDELSETVGYRISGPRHSVVWLPDIDKWERWSIPLESLLASVDRAYVDGTFFADGELSRDMALVPHPFVAETIERLRDQPATTRAKVRFVHLNHTNPALDPSGEAAAVVRRAGMSVAVEGERFEL